MAGFTRRGLNRLSLTLRAEVREMLRPHGIEITWVDDTQVLAPLIRVHTFQRWIHYRKQKNRMLTAVKSLVKQLREASLHGKIVAAGPYLYERDIQSFWWCGYGLKAHDE